MTDWHLATGYRYAGLHCGIRPDPSRLDLALILSDRPAAAAGVFTQNRVAAAPVHACRERLPRPDARGVVISSGNANACTGDEGLANARRMAELAAELTEARPHQFLVASTGVIGRPLPMPQIEAGIRAGVPLLQPGAAALDVASRAILTTDTRPKVASRRLELNDGAVCVTGFAKGAAMIGPNLATMLGFVVSDASVASADLHAILRDVADRTFNCISVEGHTSTNDTVLLLANGAGPRLRDGELSEYADAVYAVCRELSMAIANDAEGAEHLVVIDVTGCRTESEARKIAKAVADSPLVKTAIHGADPNWGRIVSAAGYSGAIFEERDLSLTVGGTLLYDKGVPVPFDAKEASDYLRNHREVHLHLAFRLGHAKCTFYTCDLTAEYIRLNADYTT